MLDKKNEPIYIKTAYKYYDEKRLVWNLFIVAECCEMYFCIHKINANIEQFISTFIVHNSASTMYNDTVYVFADKTIVNSSIHLLKQRLGNTCRKVNITKTCAQHIECLTCFSCVPLGFTIECAYKDNPDNIRQHGVRAKHRYFWREDDYSDMEDCVRDNEDRILYNDTDLSNKIYKYIQSAYGKDFNIFQEEFGCDVRGCDNNMAYLCGACLNYVLVQDATKCQSCPSVEIYTLCAEHGTPEKMQTHFDDSRYLKQHDACPPHERRFVSVQEVLDNPWYDTQMRKQVWSYFYERTLNKKVSVW